MQNQIIEAIERLRKILKSESSHRLALSLVVQKMCDYEEFDSDFVIMSIQQALDDLMVEKVIDYPSYDEGIPVGKLVWHLKLLGKVESKQLRGLKPEAKALLNVLWNCDDPNALGAVREKDALGQLRALGFEVDRVPYIPGLVDDFFTAESGENVRWHYLTPEYERARKHIEWREKQHRRASEKEIRLMNRDYQ